jgi:predicted small secreted protein
MLHVRGLEMLAIRTSLQSLCQSDALSSGTLSADRGRGALPANRGTNSMKRAIVLARWLTSVAGVTMLGATLSACNTVEGVGRDIERAGDAIQDEADDTRDRRRRN